MVPIVTFMNRSVKLNCRNISSHCNGFVRCMRYLFTEVLTFVFIGPECLYFVFTNVYDTFQHFRSLNASGILPALILNIRSFLVNYKMLRSKSVAR